MGVARSFSVHECPGGTLVSANEVCDGWPHCGDASDEAGCPGSLTCDGNLTIPAVYVCDGFPDCSDGADEADCWARWRPGRLEPRP